MRHIKLFAGLIGHLAPSPILAILRALLSVFSMADDKPSRVRNMPKRLVGEISVGTPIKNRKWKRQATICMKLK